MSNFLIFVFHLSHSPDSHSPLDVSCPGFHNHSDQFLVIFFLLHLHLPLNYSDDDHLLS